MCFAVSRAAESMATTHIPLPALIYGGAPPADILSHTAFSGGALHRLGQLTPLRGDHQWSLDTPGMALHDLAA